MRTPTDIEIAQQLEQLAQVIKNGISSANQVLEQVEITRSQVNAETANFSHLQTELETIFNRVQSTSTEIYSLQSEFQQSLDTAKQINLNAEKHVHTIQNYEQVIKNLQQDITKAYESLETAKEQLEKFAVLIPLIQDQLPQRLAEIKTNFERVTEKQNQLQELIQVNQQQIEQISSNNHTYQAIINDLSSLTTQLGGKDGLEKLQQEYQHTNQTLQNTYTEINRLQNQLESQAKKYHSLKTGLIAIACGVVLSIILAIVK